MQYTTLNIEEINAITKQHDIDKILSASVLSGGSENTNYLIHSKNKKYVLTICEQKSIEEAKHLAQLLEHLARNNFSTSRVIRTQKEELTSIYQHKPILLKSFLEGDIIKDLSSDLMELIGIQLGRLHQIKAPDYLPTALNYGIEHFGQVAIYAENSTFHIWLKKIKTQIIPYLSASLPRALIHSDVFYNNVIIEEDKSKVTIMDFEEATHYYRIFDIGMAIVGLCSENEEINLKKELFTGRNRSRKNEFFASFL